jgi:thiamine-phosphate pyrophosphorylase
VNPVENVELAEARADRRSEIDLFIPVLMLVTRKVVDAPLELPRIVAQALDGGTSMLQLRDADSLNIAGRLLILTIRRRPWWKPYGDQWKRRALAFVHGNDGYAAELAAELHLPEGREDLNAIRDEWYESMIISQSVHSTEAALRAEQEGADLLVLGTVFPSSSHPGGETIGLEGVRAVCDAVSIPVIGIGGITAANAGDVIRAGASGVAAISAIFDADDPRAAAAELRAAIDAAWAERHPPS